MKILAVICPNGLGHFRRVIDVLDALSLMLPSLKIDVVCAKRQRALMSDWDKIRNLERSNKFRWFHNLLEPGVHWSMDPSVYADGRLNKWIDSLKSVEVVHEADVVLSDNLAGMLEIRPDTVLMGSFLWSDVLSEAYPDNPKVTEFVSWERDLLSCHLPWMLCVDAMAMPGVFDRSKAVPLSWMRTTRGRPDISSGRLSKVGPKVAVLIGATGLIDSVIAEIVTALLDRGVEVALPKRLYDRYRNRLGVSLFTFMKRDFLACDFALCRPGLGSIHDCIFYGLPMVLVNDSGNAELSHNGTRIEELKLGLNLGCSHSSEEIAGRMLAFSASEELSGIRKRMVGIQMDGVKQAATWLKERLLKTGSSQM